MKWTYNRTQEYVRRVRRYTLRKGCRKCGKGSLSLELVGSPSLTRLARDGYGLERIKLDIRERGLFCRSCAKGHDKQIAKELLEGWKKEKKQFKLDVDTGNPLEVECREYVERRKGEVPSALPEEEVVSLMVECLDSGAAGDLVEAFELVNGISS